MRFIAPFAVVVALMGGYVVGQQDEPLHGAPGEKVEDGLPSDSPLETLIVDFVPNATPQRGGQQVHPLPGATGEDGLPKGLGDNDVHLVWDHQAVARERNAREPVGRYLPFGTDRLVNTITGTVYRNQGGTWLAEISFSSP